MTRLSERLLFRDWCIFQQYRTELTVWMYGTSEAYERVMADLEGMYWGNEYRIRELEQEQGR